MKTLTLDHLTEISELTELEAAVALYQLFHGNFSIQNSSNEWNAQRQRIYKAKQRGYFLKFNEFLRKYNIENVCQYFKLSVNYWHCPNNGIPINCLVPSIVKTNHIDDNIGVLNLLVDRKKFLGLQNNESFTQGLRIIVDHSYLASIRLQMKCFIDNVALFSGKSGENLIGVWPQSFSVFDERKFARIFNMGFEIWVVDAKYCIKNEEVVMVKKCVYKSTQPNFIVLQYIGKYWDNNKETIDQSDLFILRHHSDFEIFRCPNSWCFYNTTLLRDFESHCQSCTSITKVKYRQICLTDETAKEYLIRTQAISNYESYNMVSVDIETLNAPENKQISEFTFLTSTHKLISISTTCNFNGNLTRVFVRDDFSEASLMKIIHEFWGYLVFLQQKHLASFPPEFHTALATIEQKISEKPAFKASARLFACRRYLRNLFKLKAVTYNGERYDMPILFPALLKFWNPLSSSCRFNPLNVVRRGLGIMTLDYQQVIFADVRNFFPAGNLDKFGKIFKTEDVKLCFPYEEYVSIEDLTQTSSWPPYSAFKSTIKCYNDLSNMKDRLKLAFLKAEEFFSITCQDFFDQLDVYQAFDDFVPSISFPDHLIFNQQATEIFSTDPVLYVESWIKFEEFKHLGECENMLDYLKLYNSIDTKLTTGAFTKMVKVFKNQFGENLLDYPSLPGVAYKILWRHYSIKVNKPYTFSPQYGWIAKEIRDYAIQGGLCVPIHRHVEVGGSSTEYPDSVYYAKDGRRYEELIGVDAANLYGFSISEPLPGGHGIYYKRLTGGKFSRKFMIDQKEDQKTRQFSKEAIAWLSWCQSQAEFQNVKIEHYLNGGERELTLEDMTFSPDGYCQIGPVMHIFQFHGCYWHDHGCDISRKSNRVKQSRDFQLRCAKIDSLSEKYGVLHRIYGCEWSKLKRNIHFENPFDIFPGKELVSENEIVEAILQDRLFGMIKCDIMSPPNVIERYMSVNYPPITAKITPDEDMISPYILNRMKASGKKIPANQLTQVGVPSSTCLYFVF